MSPARRAPEKTAPAEWQETFVEQFGLLAETNLPRSIARVFGWLVVCAPRYQSAEQLQETLRLSAGSVSSATTTLVRDGVVARVTFPGDRRIYYQVHTDGWPRLLRARIHMLGQARHIAEQAMGAAGEATDDRLRGMHDLYARLEKLFAGLLDEVAARPPAH